MPLRAVIWDMDGVIADTAALHFEAWRDTFARRGVAVAEEQFRRTFGLRNDRIIPTILGSVPPEVIEEVSQAKETLFRSLAKGRLQPLPGVLNLMAAVNERGLKQAVGSSGPPANVGFVLKELGIERYFGAVIHGEDVKLGKPDPQVFLMAAQRLGIAPAHCVVIEDAALGVQAAKRAGMAAVAVTNSFAAAELTEADLVVDSLEKVTVPELERLVGKADAS